MTDDKQTAAMQADFEAWADDRPGKSLRHSLDGTFDYPLGKIVFEVWQAATAQATAIERERCAKVCEDEKLTEDDLQCETDQAYQMAVRHCAEAIRKGKP